MHLQRSSLSLLVLALMAGCAAPPVTAPETRSEQAAPLPQWPVASAAERKASAPKSAQDDSSAEPIIIRGNDQLLKAGNKGPTTIKGPATSFNFQDAPTAEVVQVMLRDLLKVEYVVHPPYPARSRSSRAAPSMPTRRSTCSKARCRSTVSSWRGIRAVPTMWARQMP